MLCLRPHLQTLKGASFSVAELTFARTWAHDNNLQLIIRLDHGAPGEEYEEALVFRHADIRLRQWIIWRNAEAVFVQPLVGRSRCYASIAEAMEGVIPPQRPALMRIASGCGLS